MKQATAIRVWGSRFGKRALPPGWRWVKLRDVGRFESGGTPPKVNPNYWGGDIPFVTGADVTEISISAKHARAFLTRDGLKSGKTAICHPGTVLFVTRTRVGRVGIAAEIMGASQDLSPYVCGPQVIPEYVCRYLLSISGHLLENCRGSTILGLNRDFIQDLEIPLSAPSEQKRIAVILKEQMDIIERARTAAQAQVETFSALRQSLLRSAFSGDI